MEDLKSLFFNEYKTNATHKASSFGRFEILGNHTDHNHGLCCAATCHLSISGYVRARNDNIVSCLSLNFAKNSIDLSDLKINTLECGTSNALIRGVAKYLSDKGYKIGGFDLITTSNVYAGSGLSSSAAFESLIGEIINILFNDGKIDKLTLAKAGQFAENNYFGKKSGLLDQIACVYGNISYIDFKNIDDPNIDTLCFPFDDLHFVLVNTGGSHATLSDLYSSIPEDMWSAAKKLGNNYLRECEEIYPDILTESERNRAKHFFEENKRVISLKDALKNNDKKLFLKLVNESRMSSTNYLKNMMVKDNYKGSPLEACDIAMTILKEDGACKINGGGFAGSIICVVPTFKLQIFLDELAKKYGKENVIELFINKNGPVVEKI